MTSRGKVTIEHVAAAAGVSRQTVSRVINRGPNVKAKVRERVEAAIEELGYVPNLSARRMGGGKSFLILAINDRQRTIENWESGRGNDWVDQMLFGGMTECEKHGYHLVFELIDAERDKASRQLSNAVASLRPDGVILTPPHSENDDLVALLAERSIPSARIGRRDGAPHVDVYMDERGAARQITRRLVELGHRRIAYLSGAPEYGNSRLRLMGYRDALAEADIAQDPDLIGNGDFHFDAATTEAETLLSRDPPPTAIIADNDQMAFAVLHVADRREIAIPEMLSIVSFEDTPGVSLSVPPMTAVRQPTAQMIARACAGLIALRDGKDASGEFEVPFSIVERGSTGASPP